MPARKQPARKAIGRSKAAGRRKAPAPPQYHHGDLRRALLDATESLLESAGVEGFTLREVARRAGVSHGAPAHHFGDVRGLLSAFTAESFAAMTALMKRYRDRTDGAAYEQLSAVGAAYIDYALSNRARFQLMFRSDRLDAEHEPLARAGAEAYDQLLDCIQQIASDIGSPAFAIAEKTALAWSIVHGYATLLIDNEKFAAQMTSGHTSRALAVLKSMLQLSKPAFEATSDAR